VQDVLQQQMQKQQDKAQKMIKLMENDLFQELIVDDFIKLGVQEQSLKQSLDSSKTVDELKARQILHKFLFDIMTVSG